MDIGNRTRINVILFDLDGTLVDTEWLSIGAYDFGCRQILKRSLSESEKEYILGKSLSTIVQTLFSGKDQEAIDHVFAYYSENNEQIQAYRGIRDMLDGLRASGFRMGIVTSKKRAHVEKELRNLKMQAYFEIIVTEEDTAEHKPHPAPLLEATNRMKVAPELCIYIGDQPTDVKAAGNAGMASVGALWGEGKKDRFIDPLPTYFCDTPEQLIQLVIKEIEA